MTTFQINSNYLMYNGTDQKQIFLVKYRKNPCLIRPIRILLYTK